ncbi:MAG TPA: hypothetical protein VN677_10750 [Gemmatimonadaceae bacterium]|nr:hypothetical protein [Gemmatimonadaceae bacterium]
MNLCVKTRQLVSRIGIAAACAALGLLAVACSSSVEPRAGVTLLVANASCQSGHCDAFDVLAFPSNQPSTPGGFWSLDLGPITTAQQCFTLPPTAQFRVIGQHSNGTADTVTYTWTDASSLSLGAMTPSQPRLQAQPVTSAFVPATAAGWAITIPSGTQATPAAACTP